MTSPRRPASPARERGSISWPHVAAGLAGLAVPALEWGAQLVRLTGPSQYRGQLFSQLGEPESYHGPLYGALGFYFAGVLLLVFGLGLRRALGRTRLATVSFAAVTALAVSTALLGLLPVAGDSPVVSLSRQAARAVFLWCPALAAILVGGVLARQGRRGQAAFSIGFGVVMTGYAWLTAVFDRPDRVPLEATTLWYAGMAAWLLGRSVAAGGGRLPAAAALPLVTVRVLTSAGVVAIAVLLADTLLLQDFQRLPASTAQLDGQTQVGTIDQDGIQRHYRVYRPHRTARSPGLIVVLHGSDGSGLDAEQAESPFDVEAHRLGWIALYPDGYRDGWESYGCCRHLGVDDVAFIAALIDRLRATDRVDPARVYVTGHSRGGMMSYRLGCELASRIAAIAPVAGNMADEHGSARDAGCRPARPVSVLAIQGTADPWMPILGGRSTHLFGPYAPLRDVIEVWRELDGCAAPASTAVVGPTTTTTWRCRAGSEVQTRVIAGGGHEWPTPHRQLLGAPQGPDESFDASAAIADFFAAHPHAGSAVAGGDT